MHKYKEETTTVKGELFAVQKISWYGYWKKFIEIAVLKWRAMLRNSLIQADLNKGQETPADSPWCTNGQRKLARSMVYK